MNNKPAYYSVRSLTDRQKHEALHQAIRHAQTDKEVDQLIWTLNRGGYISKWLMSAIIFYDSAISMLRVEPLYVVKPYNRELNVCFLGNEALKDFVDPDASTYLSIREDALIRCQEPAQ